MNQIQSYLLLAFAVLAVSTSAIFVKLADAPSSIIAFYRLGFALLFLIPITFSKKEAYQGIRQLHGIEWLYGIVAGILLAVHYILWFQSLRYTSIASSTVLVTLQPLFTMAFGYFLFQERHNYIALCGTAIAILGSFIISGDDFALSQEAFWGDMLAIIAAAVVALYFMAGQVARRSISATVYSFIAFLSSVIFLGLYALWEGAPFIGYDDNTWYAFLGIAFIATILGQFLLNILLKKLSATTISMSILGEPVGTCILAYILFHETLSPMQSIGIAVIFLGLTIYFLSQPIAKYIEKER